MNPVIHLLTSGYATACGRDAGPAILNPDRVTCALCQATEGIRRPGRLMDTLAAACGEITGLLCPDCGVLCQTVRTTEGADLSAAAGLQRHYQTCHPRGEADR